MSKYESKIIDIINSGEKLNVREIGEIVGCSRYTVYKVLRNNNLSPAVSRKYTIDADIFKELTSGTAWLLGFIFADGGISKTSLKISVRDYDVEVLEKARELFGSDSPIKTTYSSKDESYFVTLLVANKTIITTLREQYGCGENKTFDIRFPNLSRALTRHFIRGYFDGDGSVSAAKPKKENWSPKVRFRITSNEEFLARLQQTLVEECNLNYTPLTTRHPERNNSIRTLEYSGNRQGRRIYDYLYKDCGKYYLNRKKQKFEEILS